jgi:hypothetical protein
MPPTAWKLAALLALVAPLLTIGQQAPMVREERRVVIGGQPEVWRLEWTTPPRPACGPEDPDWFTCPCSGFAFGESGKLDLVRLRQGKETERFPLALLFEGGETPADDGDAVLRRWDVRKDDWNHADLVNSDRAGPVPGVRSRAQATVMQLGDYDHDGQSTEFLLQVSSSPCGHLYGVVVGVSRQMPRLHAFGTSANPDKPLVMDVRAWAALLHSRGPTRVVVVGCGDHASDKEIELEVSAVSGAIHVTRREYQCTENDKRGKLTSVGPFASEFP